jgi:hypothetical protein
VAEGNALRSQTLVWEPTPKQASFISCPVDDCLFGGSRGGGKTDAILGDWLGHAAKYGRDAIGICIRRERVQLTEMVERAKTLFTPLGFSYRDVDKVFVGPTGSRLRFSYLERDQDAEAFQGMSFTRLYFEEMATFPSEAPIAKLQATLRSGAGVKCLMKSTANPGGAGHNWVAERYKLTTHPQGGEVFRYQFKNPLTGKVVEKTRTYIASRVYDNTHIDLDSYVASLHQVGSAELVRAWLEGDWSAVQGAFFDGWSSKNIVPPFAIPDNWMLFRSLDWGSARPASVGFWGVPGDPYELPDGRVIPRGALVRISEWYVASGPNQGLKLTIEELAEGIIRRSRDNDYKYSVCDPSMFIASGGPSLAERLWRAGVSNLRRADNRRVGMRGAVGGWDEMRQRIRGDGETPMLFVFHTCRDFIRTIPSLQHDADRPEDLDTDAEDHIADEARYACMSRPWAPKPRAQDEGLPLNPQGRPLKLSPFTGETLSARGRSTMTWDTYHRLTNTELGRGKHQIKRI